MISCLKIAPEVQITNRKLRIPHLKQAAQWSPCLPSQKRRQNNQKQIPEPTLQKHQKSSSSIRINTKIFLKSMLRTSRTNCTRLSARPSRLLRMSPNSVNGGFQQKTLQWVKKWGGLGKVGCPSCLLSQHTAGHQTSSVLPSWCDLRPHRLSFFSKQRHQWVENILPEWPTVEWINRLNRQWINQIKPAKESIELSVSWLIKTRQCCSCHLNMLHL